MAVQSQLFQGEDVWFLGECNNLRPMLSEIAITPLRVVGLIGTELKFEAAYGQITQFTADTAKNAVEVVCSDGRSVVFKNVPAEDMGAIRHYYEHGRSHPAPEHLVRTANETVRARSAASARAADAAKLHWPQSAIRGPLTKKASEAILRQCHDQEQPWLILTSDGGAGCLVGFGDRAVIIKTGALTSFMAGSLGGERSATFHFADITGIEYNSGMVSGVLEILTPSYNGTANRDYWRGANQSRNADANSPWTLSNCLPLNKSEYRNYLPEINELKARIGQAKNPHHPTPSLLPAAPPHPPSDLVDKLRQLAAPHEAGALTDAEFAAAKARVLG